MKNLRGNYSETKDQAVPFALPALKSYKQNILFPDNLAKKSVSTNPSFEVTNRIASQSKDLAKKKKENLSNSPRQLRVPLKTTKNSKTSLNPLFSKPFSKKLPFRQAKPSSNTKPVEEQPKPLKPAVPKQSEIAETKKIISKPITARPPQRTLASVPRHKTPASYQGDNNRSNSISSATSLQQGLVPKTPQINSASTKHRLHENSLISETIIEKPRKLRNLGIRSVSRRRPKKRRENGFFDLDFGSYKMSDLSNYPLL